MRDANTSVSETSSKLAAKAALDSLSAVCGVLGLLTKENDEFPEEVSSMIREREEARKNKDWKKSDELRDALRDAGYIVEDTKQGQKVRRNV